MQITKYNREFQNIDTVEKAYVLGLIYSDGYIQSINNKSYCSTICLHENDKYLLEKIQKIFTFYKLVYYKEKTAYKLVCTCKQLCLDLYANGVYPRKSYENKIHLHVPNIDVSLIPHFIRGYFDGDGSVYRQKLGNTKIEIGGTSFSLITELIKILYDNRITVNLKCKYAGEGLRKQDFYVLYTSSDKVSKLFANYIYQNKGDLYLIRKYEKLYFIPAYNNKERLICPICGSANTVYNSIRQMKHGSMQRGICKDCNKHFSIPITAPLNSNIQSGEDELLED